MVKLLSRVLVVLAALAPRYLPVVASTRTSEAGCSLAPTEVALPPASDVRVLATAGKRSLVFLFLLLNFAAHT